VLGDWVSACAPGEFEKQAAMMLGINELLSFAPQLTVDVVGALVDHIPLIAIVVSEEQRRQAVTLLSDWGLPAQQIHFVSMPVRGMWVRDYGPTFVRWSDGSITILDAEYPPADRPNDDKVPSAVAMLLKVPVAQVPITLEGGNLLTNGQGLCVTTWAIVERNRRRGYDQHKVSRILSDYYGFYTGVYLAPLEDEKTGHADMFASFVAPDVIVVGKFDPAIDAANAKVLDRNAEVLSGTKTRRGPLKVVRIPMPSNKDGIWRSYTNVVFANGRLLVPSYPDQDPRVEEEAMDTYRQLLPSWKIIPIDCGALIRQRGALRCVTLNIPWLTERFAMPDHRYVPTVTAMSA